MIRFKSTKKWTAALLAAVLAGTGGYLAVPNTQAQSAKATAKHNAGNHYVTYQGSTTTPIKHVVVIFQENISFDHYFGTYPNALNPKGEPAFHAAPNTPSVNGLSGALLTNNPNGANPQRLDRSQAVTGGNDHSYTNEQKATDGGLMDKYVTYGGRGSTNVMNYYDGNTVTALWNYAQHGALNDNSFGTSYGPSTPGALNLVSGQTHGSVPYTANVTAGGTKISNGVVSGLVNNGTTYNDIDPYYDQASKGKTVALTGKNVGDLLNTKNISWGWFEGGFHNAAENHDNVGGTGSTDYIPHHEPFQYYQSTANPNHLAPSKASLIGKTDQANHQYDLADFWTAANSENLPAVSFLKAPANQDGHSGYSGPLDEQYFLTNTINNLEQLPSWKSTAVIIAYDDSDGWYDHVMPPLVNGSNDPTADALSGPGVAGQVKTGAYLDRAGYGPRLPLLVISPYARSNFVDNTLTDQTSVLRFIEDNWKLGRIGDQSFDAMAGSLENMFDFTNHGKNKALYLNPNTGLAESKQTARKQGNNYLKDLYKEAGITIPDKVLK
ncbi:phospholipase C [Sporolactobacillus spathodeae]|uniref:Phospholipase C n=1 Tax=Sporolactobacillus spathodeae TaxID=1465502 RepID=A0ABS2QBJ2_9BACL|nr:alkaline phosphatase family protein [Sporolactobacillus spathodeae]MBM7659179.1 phospholipase C [Sporolactobacillus spathodeae]